jgi:SAM-dependent methyltransferase
MTMPSQVLLGPKTSLVPLVDETLLPSGPGEPAIVRAAHRWYEHLIALWAPGIIEAAFDLGVFEALAGASLTSAELAEALSLDHRATRVLLNALYAYDLLGRERNTDGVPVYVLPEDAQGCLLPGSLYSLSGKIGYDRRLAWSAWRNLAAAVQTGSCLDDGSERPNQISDEHYEMLVRGINFWAPPIVEVLASALGERGWPGEQPAPRMLDVGCGSGLYGQLLAQHVPSLTVTGLDVERIVPLATTQADLLGLADRFEAVTCDFYADDWGDGFDLVFFANIFHLQTPEMADQLMAKAAAAVGPGGLIAIADHIVEDDSAQQSTQDRFFRLFAASMLATGGGDAYTAEDYGIWFSRHGLRQVALLDTPMHRIMLAKRA